MTELDTTSLVRENKVSIGIDTILDTLSSLDLNHVEAFDIVLNVLGVVSVSARLDTDMVAAAARSAIDHYANRHGDAAH